MTYSHSVISAVSLELAPHAQLVLWDGGTRFKVEAVQWTVTTIFDTDFIVDKIEWMAVGPKWPSARGASHSTQPQPIDNLWRWLEVPDDLIEDLKALNRVYIHQPFNAGANV